MRKLFLFFIPLLVSCSGLQSPEPEEDIISFSASVCHVEGVTRARTATQVTNTLDSMHVVCYRGVSGSMETLVFDEVFLGDGKPHQKFTGGRYWPLSNESYRFYASNAPIAHRVSGSYIDVTNEVDVIAASLPDPVWKRSNHLVFNHVFARLGTMLVTVSDDYVLTDLMVTIKPHISGRMFLSDNSWTMTTEGEPVVLATQEGVTAATDLYLVPGNYDLHATYSLTKGDYTEHFDRSGRVSLPAGYVSNLFTDIGKTGNAVDVSYAVEVIPWYDEDHIVFF